MQQNGKDGIKIREKCTLKSSEKQRFKTLVSKRTWSDMAQQVHQAYPRPYRIWLVLWLLVTQDVKIPGVPKVTLAGIWCKADAIVSKSSDIFSPPGSDDSKLVESKSGKRPHFVTKEKSERFMCDDRYKMWLSTCICAHTVAVAHTMNLLSSFVDWHKTYKGTPQVCQAW